MMRGVRKRTIRTTMTSMLVKLITLTLIIKTLQILKMISFPPASSGVTGFSLQSWCMLPFMNLSSLSDLITIMLILRQSGAFFLPLNIFTTNYNDLGTYAIQMTGKYDFSPLYQQVLFQVFITGPCAQNIVVPPILKKIELLPEVKYARSHLAIFRQPILACAVHLPTPNLPKTQTPQVRHVTQVLMRPQDNATQSQAVKAWNRKPSQRLQFIGAFKNGFQALSELKIIFKFNPPEDLASTFGSMLLNASSAVLKNMTADLVPKLTSINTKGQVQISFSKPILEIQNLSSFEEHESLSFQHISASNSLKIKRSIVTWHVTAFTKHTSQSS
ncbi:hypothetical protein FGO68_gene284 [Halteria grandinella]|uniref:Uncharacterized protein n=1 Tax=Halteria grandinella TaxID=5974 RepID=A0A8J8NWR7_HALGN|nr:hypothetical protein FGO68_gene284 [Halteria grandinella]